MKKEDKEREGRVVVECEAIKAKYEEDLALLRSQLQMARESVIS